jgi:hypothetical protein
VPVKDGVGHVQAGEDFAGAVERAVTVGVLVNGNDITSAIVIRRSGWDAVEGRAVILVAADHLEAGGIRILAVLRDPKATPGVETEVSRLRDHRFVQEQVHRGSACAHQGK